MFEQITFTWQFWNSQENDFSDTESQLASEILVLFQCSLNLFSVFFVH